MYWGFHFFPCICLFENFYPIFCLKYFVIVGGSQFTNEKYYLIEIDVDSQLAKTYGKWCISLTNKHFYRICEINCMLYVNSSAIRQKGKSQNGCFNKTKNAKFFENRTFLTPWYAHLRMPIKGKKCSFLGKFGVLCFLETPVLRFVLLAYYRRFES